MLKKLLVLLLIMLLSFSMIACDTEEVVEVEDGDQNEQNNDGTNDLKDPNRAETPPADPTPDEKPDGEVEEEEKRTAPAPAVLDMGGYEFKIRNDLWSEYEFAAPTRLNGSGINDAVYRRNKKVEQLYNITIVECGTPSGNVMTIASELNRFHTAGAYYADLYSIHANTLISNFGKSGYFYNVYDLENLDLEQEWWDQGFLAATTFNGHAYALTGDIQANDDLRTQILTVNHTLFKAQFPSADLYKTVLKDGAWTLEAAYGFLQNSGKDGGTKGTIEAGDRIGLSYDSSIVASLFAASGEKVFSYKPNSNPKVNFATWKNSDMNPTWSDTELNFLEMLKAILSGSSSLDAVQANTRVSETAPQNYEDARKHFVAGGTIFKTGYLLDAPEWYEEMEQEIYYLPYPKYSADQERYHTLVHMTVQPLAIPKEVGNRENVALITEALAYYSDTLKNEIVEFVLPEHQENDVYSRKLLKLTLDSKYYDIDTMIYITGYFSQAMNLLTTNTMDQYQFAMEGVRSKALGTTGMINMYLRNY